MMKSLVITPIAVLLIIVIGYLDYLTGFEIDFTLFYFIPLAAIAWQGGIGLSLGTSVLCTVVWYLADLQSMHPYSHPVFETWNIVVHLIVFGLIAWVTWKARQHANRINALNAELQVKLAQIKELKGLLPICAWCKKIRNDKGFWQGVERYISDHTAAEFTHGICPECMEKQLAILQPDQKK